ncbi:hypothetical protein MC885_003981, partial [Smutsia gigantea]
SLPAAPAPAPAPARVRPRSRTRLLRSPSGPRRPPRASRPPPLPFAPTPALLLRASRLKNNSRGAASSALRHCPGGRAGGTRTRRPRSRAGPWAQRAGHQRGQQSEHRAPRTSPPGGRPAHSCLRGPQGNLP